jgi:hypothetical protein
MIFWGSADGLNKASVGVGVSRQLLETITMGFAVADKSDLELVGVPTQAASAAPRAPKILNSARPAPPRTVVTRPAVRRVHAHVFVFHVWEAQPQPQAQPQPNPRLV